MNLSRLSLVLLAALSASTAECWAFKMVGKGENCPTVQSSLYGTVYVRTIPYSDYGTDGVTRVFSVKRDQDKPIDEYPAYMRGELFLGWSPLLGKYCLVQLEPERITSVNDFSKAGKISRLAFYAGGAELASYTGDDLRALGLDKRCPSLGNNMAGHFMVCGIEQVPMTNHYVFTIKKTVLKQHATEVLHFDITTGKLADYDALKNPPTKQAEPTVK